MALDWRNSLGPRQTIQDINRMLFETARFSDVVFLVGQNKIPIKAHKFILMTRSCVFETMFGDTWRDETGINGNEVTIPDAEPEVFKSFLKFLYYNDTTDFTQPIDVLYLAHKYSVPELIKACAELLKDRMDVDTVLSIYYASKLFDLGKLKDIAMSFMLRNAKDFVKDPAFLTIDEATLSELASNDELCIKEIDLFLAIKSWAAAECFRREMLPTHENMKTVLENLIGLVRFPLMTPEQFSLEIVNSEILDQRQIIELFMHLNVACEEKRKELPELPYSRVPRAESDNINVAENMSRRYNVGVYLCNETCARDSLSYRVGPNGLLHDEDLIFSANKDIEVVGLGLYGPGKIFIDPRSPLLNMKSYEVEMNLYTLSPHESQRSILAEVRRCVSTREDYEVNFLHPVLIRKNRVYHIRLAFKGEETKHGVSRLSHVATNCGADTILFTFHGPFGTGSYGHPDGRIRSIVFNYPGIVNMI